MVPIEQKAEARYDISESLPKKKGTQNTKSSWRNKKEESKPTLLKQMSTASQHISDVEEVDFPEVDQKRVKKKAPKLVEAKIKSTENKVFKDNAKTAFGIGDETSAKNNPDDKSKSTQYKTSKISKKVQGSLKRRHEVSLENFFLIIIKCNKLIMLRLSNCNPQIGLKLRFIYFLFHINICLPFTLF